MKIVVAIENDIEATRHHISMASPLGDVFRWVPNQLSAFDMFDTIEPDLVICSHVEYINNRGLQCLAVDGLNMLVRYEDEGEITLPNVINYTRYRSEKEYLPSCADVINFKKMGVEKDIEQISFRNYVGEHFLARTFSKELLKNPEKEVSIKVFRGYNVKTPFSCGDINDKLLCEYVNRAKLAVSHFRGENYATMDVLNALHCGAKVKPIFKSMEQAQVVLQDFKDVDITQNLKSRNLPKNYTNIDRAKKIRSLL